MEGYPLTGWSMMGLWDYGLREKSAMVIILKSKYCAYMKINTPIPLHIKRSHCVVPTRCRSPVKKRGLFVGCSILGRCFFLDVNSIPHGLGNSTSHGLYGFMARLSLCETRSRRGAVYAVKSEWPKSFFSKSQE